MAAQAAHGSHSLHGAFFGEAGARMPIALCTACGAHGSQKAINLAARCPAAGLGRNASKADAFYTQARRAQRGFHPSKPGVKLHGMRLLKAAASAANVGDARRVARGRKRAAMPEPVSSPVTPPRPLTLLEESEHLRDEGRETLQALAANEADAAAAGEAAAAEREHGEMDEEALFSDVEL